jgi:hypothetical protein
MANGAPFVSGSAGSLYHDSPPQEKTTKNNDNLNKNPFDLGCKSTQDLEQVKQGNYTVLIKTKGRTKASSDY